ncbi:hypothetical protein ACTG4Q_21010 [Bradyrhizobium denitrificans]
MDFSLFKHAVAAQFKKMSGGQLFCTDLEKDDLWATYLGSFPAGTNPVFRERTEHDCSCCRQFIRAVGNIVSIVDGKLVSIWDGKVNDPTYQIVSDAMSALVKSKPITNEFLTTEGSAGTDKNFEDILGKVQTWEHFHVKIPSNFVLSGAKIGPRLADTRAAHDVFLRGLTELTMDSLDTVLELIAQNSLYRGSEHKFAVEAFRKAKVAFDKLPAAERDPWVWLTIKANPGSVTRIRNTSIGTLLIDLSADTELEAAVKKFETSIMAPANYKRPTALVTPAMIAKAKATVSELGLTSALERRYARPTDISVENILFADNATRKVINGDVFDTIQTKASKQKLDKVQEVPIEKFISQVLPNAESIEVMFENSHLNNLVSLIAPVDPAAAPLFKWENNFSWAYNGDMTDSIKERVKKAGGNVTGDLCCRLAWSNYDDLDFHMREPRGHVYFGAKHSFYTGGQLDVDMNAGHRQTRQPVENIFYPDRKRMKEGEYLLQVNQFSKREAIDVGFEVEIDYLGQVWRFAYDKPLRHGETVTVATLRYSHAKGLEIVSSLPSTQAGKTVWGLPTHNFHKVNMMMLSPNYWNGRGVGNKHYFFMLDSCQNDGQARGFFNEFLREDLTPHRKVIDIVGAKMKAEHSADQISGLGFSSTQRGELLAKVKGNFTRTVKVVF